MAKIFVNDTNESVNSNPCAVIKKHWNEIPNGICSAHILCGPAYMALILRVDNGFGCAYIIGYALESPIFAKLINYVWTDL